MPTAPLVACTILKFKQLPLKRKGRNRTHLWAWFPRAWFPLKD
jgi:hypothetical protein